MVVSRQAEEFLPTIPAAYAGSGFSLPQLASILGAYWKLSLAIFVACVALTVAVILVIPKAYTASATLIFDYQNRNPLAGDQLPAGMLQSYIATQTELMTSPVILNEVVDRLNLTHDPQFSQGAKGDPAMLRDYAARVLASRLAVYEGRGGQLLYVSATSRTAERAAEIANTVADTFLSLHEKQQSEPATDRARRYSAQLGELRVKVAAAQAKVTEFRQRNGLANVTAGPTDVDMQGLTVLQSQLIEAQNARRVAESRSQGDRAASDEALASNTVSTLKAQLDARQAELAKLSSTLGPQHPKIVELQAQIAATKAALEGELSVLARNKEQRVATSRDLEGKYVSAIGAQRQKLLATRELQDEAAKLMVELESAQSVYKRALDGYDQIMFASDGHAANVSLIDRATPPIKPSKPSKVKLMMAGLGLGFFVSLLAPLGYEILFNRRVRHRDDLERELGLKVLSELGFAVGSRLRL
jgi:polysaccharide biosynthesis transport protein